MSFEYTNGFTRLNQQAFVVFELFQAFEDFVVAGPVSGCATDAAVYDQFIRLLGHFGIEIVLDHPIRRFGEPAFAVQF